MAMYDHEKKAVLETSRWLSEQGYFGTHRGTGGNVSLRAGTSAMVITPSSVKYEEISVDDVFVVGLDLSVIEGNSKMKPSVESGLHSIVYKNRPDVSAVVHTHQIYSSVFAVINTPIPALFDEVSFALGPMVEIIPYALSGTPELAEHVGAKLSNQANAYIIQNHGILALGKTLPEAVFHAELLEKAAHIYYLALSTGKTVTTLPESTIELVAAMRGYQIKKSPEEK
ncbi:MAG: class II aldolase/adducin family protein [Deltaproteobacteria bacterium]|nr:class II aldolase/adducin family protein [Deltaproteobacteria bacterium]